MVERKERRKKRGTPRKENKIGSSSENESSILYGHNFSFLFVVIPNGDKT
ncbi:hypothetical protein L3Q82_020891, partial [Scortum barcoo]